MSSALCVFIHASETGRAEGVPIAPSRGRSVEFPSEGNVSGYVCNHGSPSGERDTASPRGRYGERLSVTRV